MIADQEAIWQDTGLSGAARIAGRFIKGMGDLMIRVKALLPNHAVVRLKCDSGKK